MVKEANLNKFLYKSLLGILKFIPMLSAVCCLLNTIFAYIGIDTPAFSYVGSMSILSWLFVFIASIVFKFCAYHRMFLYYILVTDIIDTIDYFYGIPMEDYNFFVLHIIITGICLFLILYLYVRNSKKTSFKSN